MTIYSIYKATNKVNGKSYIGFAARWPARQQEHYWESFRKNHTCYHSHFHRAIRKHGWESFEWELLYQSKDGTHTLREMENFFILEHNTYEKGYNQTLGGDGSLGRKHSEETKAKIRAKRKLQVISDETKELWSKNRKGKPKSEEMKKKTSQRMMGKKHSLGLVRKTYQVISPTGETFIAGGIKELEKYVPYWVSKLGHKVVQGKYVGWEAFPMDGKR